MKLKSACYWFYGLIADPNPPTFADRPGQPFGIMYRSQKVRRHDQIMQNLFDVRELFGAGLLLGWFLGQLVLRTLKVTG